MDTVNYLREAWQHSPKRLDDNDFYREVRSSDFRPQAYVPTGIAFIDDAVTRLGVRVDYEAKDSPAYNNRTDTIHMLPIEAFTSFTMYQHAMAHELTHWTGGATEDDPNTGDVVRINRLRREMHSQREYNHEELVADIGAAIILDSAGLFGEAQQQSTASYVRSFLDHYNWFTFLGMPMPGQPLSKQEALAVFDKAAAQAREAVAYLKGA